MSKYQPAFTLLELVLVLSLLGILLTFGIPQFSHYTQSACIKKLQLQVLNLKLTLKAQKQQKLPTDWNVLYQNLDLKPSSCSFEKQKNGFIANDNGRKAYFVLKNLILECQHTKSARLHNGESLCDIF
ncbi:prepilin-type N-terminal cleavage/methylation domain-containing protein [uncultured Helicobacter sp.]|uniref:prepilin-type N-terminal cleavage/methylation domain-containing protein n=1 Tax=uncultured Helicobacter sp. TaxID=175537 RepID=UPI00262BE8D3|nr:prepilin-type N-terminal cleavage/methylation domain-containing protein [uncultured Helicobacter sp.]